VIQTDRPRAGFLAIKSSLKSMGFLAYCKKLVKLRIASTKSPVRGLNIVLNSKENPESQASQ
jgi:hypothetical protein